MTTGIPERDTKVVLVFLGDRVTDIFGRPAIFEELASSPAALEAGKLVDLYGCLVLGRRANRVKPGETPL